MDCETGKKLHEKEAAATEAVGRYSRSLKGVAPAPEHRKEMDRLRSELAKAGVAAAGVPPEAHAALIELDNGDAPSEYRLGFANFYVLTRYNRSSYYAAAVMDLAAALRAGRQPEGR